MIIILKRLIIVYNLINMIDHDGKGAEGGGVEVFTRREGLIFNRVSLKPLPDSASVNQFFKALETEITALLALLDLTLLSESLDRRLVFQHLVAVMPV